MRRPAREDEGSCPPSSAQSPLRMRSYVATGLAQPPVIAAQPLSPPIEPLGHRIFKRNTWKYH